MAEVVKENGGLKLIVSNRSEFEDFFLFTQKLEKDFKFSFIEKIDDFDSLYWIFEFQGTLMVTSFDTFLGISIYPKNGRDASELDNEKLYELKNILKL